MAVRDVCASACAMIRKELSALGLDPQQVGSVARAKFQQLRSVPEQLHFELRRHDWKRRCEGRRVGHRVHVALRCTLVRVSSCLTWPHA